MPNPTHRCLLCGTEYYAPGECDWCPDVKLVPIQSDPHLAGDLENLHLKTSGEFQRRRDQQALQEQQQRLGTGL